MNDPFIIDIISGQIENQTLVNKVLDLYSAE